VSFASSGYAVAVIYLLDSSALVKLVIDEPGPATQRIRRLFDVPDAVQRDAVQDR
jgi:hypothetical protein